MEVTIEDLHAFVGLPACSTQDDCILLNNGAFEQKKKKKKKRFMYLRQR